MANTGWRKQSRRHRKAYYKGKRKTTLQTKLSGDIAQNKEIKWTEIGTVGTDRRDLAERILERRNKHKHPYGKLKTYSTSTHTYLGVFGGRKKSKRELMSE